MNAIRNIFKYVVAACVATLLFVQSPAAQETSTLMDELRLAEDAATASRIERELYLNWSRSGSPAMDLLLQRGRDALEVGDLAAALEHLSALTDHAPEFAEGWHLRASALFQMNLIGPAISDLERTLVLNPEHFGALYGLGVIFEQIDRPERAYAVYRMVQGLHPHYKDLAETLTRLEPRMRGTSL